MGDPAEVIFETPQAMMGRLRLGREEHCQRLLTCLLLHGPYPRWNTRSRLSAQGVSFLHRLHDRCFGDGWPSGDAWFVDEYELAPRSDSEKGAAPDYAVLWDDRVWLIELKTEKGSHRAAQVPYYSSWAATITRTSRSTSPTSLGGWTRLTSRRTPNRATRTSSGLTSSS